MVRANNIMELTDETFATGVQSDKRVLVDFWASWCAPCRVLGRTLDQLNSSVPVEVQDVSFAKIDIDTYPEIKEQFSITAIPLLILFENGKEVRRLQGAKASTEIRRFISGKSSE